LVKAVTGGGPVKYAINGQGTVESKLMTTSDLNGRFKYGGKGEGFGRRGGGRGTHPQKEQRRVVKAQTSEQRHNWVLLLTLGDKWQ